MCDGREVNTWRGREQCSWEDGAEKMKITDKGKDKVVPVLN
jgi:hypothetical protein